MSEINGPQSRSFVYRVSIRVTPALRSTSKFSSLISVLHSNINSPVFSSAISLATGLPIRYSRGTCKEEILSFSSWRICLAVILRPFSTTTLFCLPLISKAAISPLSLSGSRANENWSFLTLNTLVSKNTFRISSEEYPKARSKIVDGNFLLLSIRT